MTVKTPNRGYPIMPGDSVQLWKIYNDAMGIVDSDVETIVTFLKLDANILRFGVGADPTWIMNNGLVPLTQVSTLGATPPTIAANIITINSPGLYEINALFGIDIVSGNNSVVVQMQVNGAPAGVAAGVEFSGGQSAPIVQPTSKSTAQLLAGDEITFVVTQSGVDDKLLYWNISGGSVTQMQYDFDLFPP